MWKPAYHLQEGPSNKDRNAISPREVIGLGREEFQKQPEGSINRIFR